MSGPRAVLAHKRLHARPDRDPDAPPVEHEMKCSVCGEEPVPDGTWEPPRTWVLEHSAMKPGNHSCIEIITRPWRTWMEP